MPFVFTALAKAELAARKGDGTAPGHIAQAQAHEDHLAETGRGYRSDQAEQHRPAGRQDDDEGPDDVDDDGPGDAEKTVRHPASGRFTTPGDPAVRAAGLASLGVRIAPLDPSRATSGTVGRP